MSVFRTNNITNRDATAGPVISGITTVSSTGYMRLPVGPTEYRGGRDRGIIANGGQFSPGSRNIIDYITISTAGNALDFGDTTQAREGVAMVSSSTRGISAGGGQFGTPIYNILDYITISSTGNAFDFGDLTTARRETAGVSNSTRGIIAGGYFDSPIASDYTTIDYVTIASLGNASFFGDLLTKAREIHCGLCNSSTRGVFGGGATPSLQNVIQFVTISTLGNTQDFGDLTSIQRNGGACSNSTRGLFGGGNNPSNIGTVEYITIASTGNSQNFGNLSQTRNSPSGLANQTRGVFTGGYIAPTAVNTIDFVTITSIGNATDFGDLTQARGYLGSCSDAHGGLG